MAKPDKMPQRSVIDGFKGLVDFYYWKGVAVARSWPQYRTRTPTQAEATNQADFAYINRLYGTLPAIVLQGLIQQARGTTQVPKDYLVRAYLKGLFTLMPPEYYATEETLQEVSDRIGAVDGSDPGSAIDRLADLLTELNAKLEPTDLNIEAVSLDLQVDDKTDYLNHGNLIRSFNGTHHPGDGSVFTILNYSGKGVIESLEWSSEDRLAECNLAIDGANLTILGPGGGSMVSLTPGDFNALGGETNLWKLLQYDVGNNYYYIGLKRPIQFNSGILFTVTSNAGALKWITGLTFYRDLT